MLHAEITRLGYRGSLRNACRYLQPLRTAGAGAPAAIPPPKIGEVTGWLLRHPDDLDTREQQMLAGPRARCSQPGRLAGHVTSFAKMMTSPSCTPSPPGPGQDLAAVTAGLTLPHGSGTVEGNVNQPKAIKRQMYGRATPDLLWKRAINHSA